MRPEIRRGMCEEGDAKWMFIAARLWICGMRRLRFK